jgi:DNA-binding transcriptional ArsR family regulator
MTPDRLEVSPTQIKVLSDPSRLRILTMLFEREASISGLAKALGLTPATVHHHVNKLREAGLIRRTRQEQRGNLVETYYTMPAKDIETSLAWNELRDEDKVAYRLAVLGMLKGMINAAMNAIQGRGTVEWEVGRLLLYRLPYRRDVIQQVEEIVEDARRRLERLEAQYKSGETEPEHSEAPHVTVVMTTMPA